MSDDTLPGTPSDEVPAILECGDSGISHLFLSMARRHPEGRDADYLRWHSLDHRPEQMRLPGFRASIRVVSTPQCRAARQVSDPAFDPVDHVMTYCFDGGDAMDGFIALSDALRDAGRSPFILDPVQRGFYQVRGRRAAARDKVGADVLPWLPTRGLYLLVEEGEADNARLLEVEGVAGVWDGEALPSVFSSVETGQRLSICFLTGDPLQVAASLKPVLEQRWRDASLTPLLAAPFYTLVPYEWDRYLPQG